jgi:Mrp family chromosome partitioning ATPase
MTTALATATAIAYVSTAGKVYEANVDILVTPLSRENQILGLGLIHESVDPTRDVETIARLAESTLVAARVKRALGLTDDPETILARVRAEPLAQSNLVTITARGGTPREAAELANSFSREFLDMRTQQLHQSLDAAIPRVEARVKSLEPGSVDASELPAELTRMRLLRESPDPTVRAESVALLPKHQIAPRPIRSTMAAIVGGVILGVLAVLALRLLDSRVRSEDQLRERYRLPILARIPRERAAGRLPLVPGELSLAARDAYARLHANVLGLAGQQHTGRIVMVTGASPGDAKSTTAINLAMALAEFDRDVILVDGDIRRSTLPWALDLPDDPRPAESSLVSSGVERALVPVPGEERVRVLVADAVAALFERFPTDGLERAVREASELCDFVVVDLPPLHAVPPLLPLVSVADDVLVVVRLGKTSMRDLGELAEVFSQQRVAPSGFVLVGTTRRQPYY